MLKAEVGRESGVRVEVTGTCTRIAADVLEIIQAIYCSMLKLDGGDQRAEEFRCCLAIGLRPDAPVWRPIQGEDTSIVAQGAAADALARAFEGGGGSMTAIDLTRDQCAALDKPEGGDE